MRNGSDEICLRFMPIRKGRIFRNTITVRSVLLIPLQFSHHEIAFFHLQYFQFRSWSSWAGRIRSFRKNRRGRRHTFHDILSRKTPNQYSATVFINSTCFFVKPDNSIRDLVDHRLYAGSFKIWYGQDCGVHISSFFPPSYEFFFIRIARSPNWSCLR